MQVARISCNEAKLIEKTEINYARLAGPNLQVAISLLNVIHCKSEATDRDDIYSFVQT